MAIFLKSYIIWCFHFRGVLFVITNPSLCLYDYSNLSPYIHLFISTKLTWPQKILEVSSGSPPPHPTPLPPLVMGGEDAMILNGLGQLLFSSLLSMLLPMVFRFTVKDFIWMEEPSTFLKNEQNEKVQKCEELHKVTKAAFTGYF